MNRFLIIALTIATFAGIAQSADLNLSVPKAALDGAPDATPEAAAPAADDDDDAVQPGAPQRLDPIVVHGQRDAFGESDAKLKRIQDGLSCMGCDGTQRDLRPKAVKVGEAIGQALFGLFSSYKPRPTGEPNDRALNHAEQGISTYDNPGGGTVRPNQP